MTVNNHSLTLDLQLFTYICMKSEVNQNSQTNIYSSSKQNSLGVMFGVLTLSVVDHGFEPLSRSKTKTTKHAA
jgi:hypothetical protein